MIGTDSPHSPDWLRAKSTWVAAALALAALVAVFATVAGLWSEVGASDISVGGWIAMFFGVLATLGVGVGLMSLVFISNRRGFDEPGGGGGR